MIAQLAKRDIEANGLPAKLSTSTQRRRALDGADYVLNTTRIGGLDAFALDVDIPLKYGVDQCVGDTLCAGGIIRPAQHSTGVGLLQRHSRSGC